MADYVVNSLDLSKLETQLRFAIEEDERYKRENAAKFRAIEQSKTYEEFRNIVKASHLKPLDKNESIHVQHIRPASWNICANKNKSTIGCPPITLATALAPATKKKLDEVLPSELGYHNFSDFWTLFSEDQVGRIRLLEKAFLGENIFKGHDFSIDLLVEILETLNGYVDQNHHISNETWDLVIKSMQSISSMPRFSLHLLFLSEKERSAIKELKERVKTHLEEKERRDNLGNGVDMSLAFLDDF